jgi:tryptophan-rich sensory protein
MKYFLKQPHLVAAGIWIFIVAFIGGLLTEIGPWYYSLNQPGWKPPDWSFGVIWTIIFIFSGVAWSFAWRSSISYKDRLILSILFILNGFFNVLWSLLFFKLHRPDLSLIEAIFLWLSVLAIILCLLGYSKKASLLMLPYLIWVSIAMLLNWQIVMMNDSFTS